MSRRAVLGDTAARPSASRLAFDYESFFFHPREKVGRKTPAPLFRAEIRVSKTRRREAETGLGGRHPITTGPH